MFYCRMREASWLLLAGTALGILLPQVAWQQMFFFYIHIYIVYIYIGIKSFERYFVEDQHGFIQPFSKF